VILASNETGFFHSGKTNSKLGFSVIRLQFGTNAIPIAKPLYYSSTTAHIPWKTFSASTLSSKGGRHSIIASANDSAS